MSNDILLALIVAVQAIATAYIDHRVKKYGCGGDKCKKMIKSLFPPVVEQK